MQTLFHHAEGDLLERQDDAVPEPCLLIEWPSWPRVFFGNLWDLLASPFRRELPLQVSSRPAAFWPDVFVHRRMPLAPLRQSALYHLFVVVSIWGLSHTWLARPRIQPRSPFENAKISYYPVSAYLPALIDEAAESPRVEKKGDPVHARQRIRSVPRRPDNARQTIVTPSPLTIHNDVPLPNIVAWNQPVPPAPVSAAASLRAQTAVPLQASPVLPAPLPVRSPRPVAGSEAVLPVPPPTINVASSKPKLELPTPVLPATSPKRPLGDPRVSQIVPSEALPRVPVTERSAVPLRPVGRRREAAEMAAVPAPSLADTGAKASDMQRLVALGIHPALPERPQHPPEGNRRGSFEAAPEGKPSASGTPDTRGDNRGGGATSSEIGTRTPLPGVTVERPPVEMAAVRPPSVPSARDVFAQALARARAPDIPRPRSAPAAGPEPKVEDFGAGPKRYYSMVLNMPNLTSSSGSWIIHFAELHESQDHAPVSAPMATVKVDPAYPAELLRNGIGGVVLLYAIIRADGSVSAVRVLRGVEARLDASASAALQKWHFLPGTRNGSAVDLEAVVQIPFRARPIY